MKPQPPQCHRAAANSALALLAIIVFAQPAAAQWTQGAPGRTWVKVAYLRQSTDRRFNELGDDDDFLPKATSDARAIFIDVITGLHRNVDLWVQASFFDLRFNQKGTLGAKGDTLRSGLEIGDVRWWLRWKLTDLGGSTPIAIRVGAKAPIGTSPLDARTVPAGEGQWDFEGWGEIGHSFWPLPIYSIAWVGYRARLKNTNKQKDPSGEYAFLTEVGVNPTSRTLLKVTTDGLFGRAWTVEGLKVSNATRRLLSTQLSGSVNVVKDLWAEVGVKFSISGRNFPNGAQLVTSLSTKLPFAR
ncbi:MAG: hypothetical protein ACE5HT_10200 [Gemmatimonadales bacterium]